MKRETYIAGIRALADFLEAYPEMPLPTNPSPNFYAFASKEQLPVLLRQASFAKRPGEIFYAFAHQITPEFRYELAILRSELCERVLIGTRKVKKPVVPQTEIEVDEPVYEWKCPDSILRMIA